DIAAVGMKIGTHRFERAPDSCVQIQRVQSVQQQHAADDLVTAEPFDDVPAGLARLRGNFHHPIDGSRMEVHQYLNEFESRGPGFSIRSALDLPDQALDLLNSILDSVIHRITFRDRTLASGRS